MCGTESDRWLVKRSGVNARTYVVDTTNTLAPENEENFQRLGGPIKVVFSMKRNTFEDGSFLEQGVMKVHFLHSADGLPQAQLRNNEDGDTSDERELFESERTRENRLLDDFLGT